VYVYRLRDKATVVRSPEETKYFSFSLCVHISFEAHPASYPRAPGAKCGRGVTLTAHPDKVQRARMKSYISSRPCRLHDGSGTALLYNLLLSDLAIVLFDNIQL
jgi:hypothetical protein